MAKFLVIDEDEDAPVLINVDQIVAIECEDVIETADNAMITIIVRDWEVQNRHELVRYGKRKVDPAGTENYVWHTRLQALMMGRYYTARAAITEALRNPDPVVDLTEIANRHGLQWCDEHPDQVTHP